MDSGVIIGLSAPVLALAVAVVDLYRLDKGMLIAASPLLAICAIGIGKALYTIVGG